MLNLNVGEVEYNKILHDLLKLSCILKRVHCCGDDESFHEGLEILGDVRERMLELISDKD